MRLTPESAEQIARTPGLDPAKATVILEDMVRKGLISAIGEGEQRKFGLMPFIGGVYGSQLGRLDEETAHLFEKYYLEAFAEGFLSEPPSYFKVIPVEKSLPFEVQRPFLYLQLLHLLLRGHARNLPIAYTNSVAKSDFYAMVDPEACTGCGTCLERCQFSARSLLDNISQVDQKR